MPDHGDRPLLEALAAQARLGILGLEPAEALAHSRRYDAVLAPGSRVIDLGSGGGIPGLVVAFDRPDLTVTLLDARQKRTDQLHRLVRRLGLQDRVRVVCDRVEHFGAVEAGAFDCLVARRFGPPAQVLAAAGALVGPRDGLLAVSAAPDDRWDVTPGWVRVDDAPASLVVLRRP